MDQYYREWREKNRDKTRAAQIRYAIKNKEKRAESSRSYCRKMNGFSPEKVRRLLILQNGCCAICDQPFKDGAFHADHDHKTRTPRGLLCRACNHGLGNFLDDASLLSRAIAYLIKHASKGVKA